MATQSIKQLKKDLKDSRDVVRKYVVQNTTLEKQMVELREGTFKETIHYQKKIKEIEEHNITEGRSKNYELKVLQEKLIATQEQIAINKNNYEKERENQNNNNCNYNSRLESKLSEANQTIKILKETITDVINKMVIKSDPFV